VLLVAIVTSSVSRSASSKERAESQADVADAVSRYLSDRCTVAAWPRRHGTMQSYKTPARPLAMWTWLSALLDEAATAHRRARWQRAAPQRTATMTLGARIEDQRLRPVRASPPGFTERYWLPMREASTARVICRSSSPRGPSTRSSPRSAPLVLVTLGRSASAPETVSTSWTRLNGFST